MPARSSGSTSALAKPRDLELNEANWWALWCDLSWFGNDSYVLLSRDFDEYFFNRAGFLECREGSAIIPVVEHAFEVAGRTPCFTVPEECRETAQAVESAGYDTFDRMSVMRLGGSVFGTTADEKVSSGHAVDAVDWATTYSLSFYGDLRAKVPVTKIATRLESNPAVTLLASKKAGELVGVLAAFRTPALLGVYCVGTLKEHRRSGVASSLLSEASRIALSESRELVLQTIVSDGVGMFYVERGFSEVYSKLLMRKEIPGAKSARSA